MLVPHVSRTHCKRQNIQFISNSAERKMTAGASAQMQVTFEDIAVCFSQEEWGYLDEGQKQLYKEVMMENYQTLISLYSVVVTPEIISHIERGEEPYIRDEPGSEEREAGKSCCSADQQITQEMEQIQKQSENVRKNISKGAKRRDTTNCPQESEEQRDLARDSLATVIEYETRDKELTNVLVHQKLLADRSFQNNNSDMVTSKLNKEDGKRKKDQKEYTSSTYQRSPRFILPKNFPLFIELQMQKGRVTEEKPFLCTECNKTFAQFSTLKHHQVIHMRQNNGEKPFTCTECNKSYTQLSSLKTHLRTHTGERPFICTECNKSFLWHSYLKIHQKTHTGEKPFICTECNKSFLWRSYLKIHQKTHTGSKAYTCTECNKSYTQLSSLKAHLRTHTGEKPFTCTECNKSFKWLSNLKLHQKTHTEDKSFICTECNKSFAQLSYLKKHLKTHT